MDDGVHTGSTKPLVQALIESRMLDHNKLTQGAQAQGERQWTTLCSEMLL
jgi:hypothetical protein